MSPVEKVVVATPIHVPFTLAKVCPLVPVYRDEVETAEGMAVAPVTFARTEFAAMVASDATPPAYERPLEKVVVAAAYTLPSVFTARDAFVSVVNH